MVAMKTGWRAVAAIVVLGLLLPTVARSDYKESFKAGMEAVDRKNWDLVARHMQEAIDQNPKSGGDVRIAGTRMEDYLPYYYLGMALNELGRYVEAKAALDEATSQGALASAPKRVTRNAFRLISEVGAKVGSLPSTTRDTSQNPRSAPVRQPVPTGPTPAQQLATARSGATNAFTMPRLCHNSGSSCWNSNASAYMKKS